MKKNLYIRLFLVVSSLLVGCNSNSFEPTSTVSSSSKVPYPINTPAALPSGGAYPVNTPEAIPSAKGKITPFHLDKLLFEGTTQVTGTGPAGVPISLQDVTFMGTVLAQTVIGSDDTFMFQVTALEKNHRIGIALGDLTGTRWKPEDFNNAAYQGEEPMLVPQVGFFYDTALVQAK